MHFSSPQNAADSEPLRLVEFALSNMKDAVYLIDYETRFFYVNNEACRMLDYSNEEFLTMCVSDIDPDWSKENINVHWNRLIKEKLSGSSSFETQHKSKYGLMIPVEVSSNPFVYKGENYSMCVVRDLRERQSLEQLAYAREQEFQALAGNSPDVVVRFNIRLQCLYANQAALRHLNVSAEQLRGRRLRDLLGNLTCVSYVEQRVSEVIAHLREAEGELVESDNLSSQGIIIHHLRCVPEFDRYGALVSVLTIGRDITAIRYAEKKLEDSHMRLRLLARQREASREAESKRIAREVHDELGQHLTSLRMGISLLRLQFSKDNPQLHERVLNLMSLADKTIQVVRNVATRLRPNVLDMGLSTALEWLRDEFTSRHPDCCCQLITPVNEILLDDEQSTAAFRVVQESLTNVTRHADATEVIITLQRRPGVVVLSVKDNGKGFDSRQRSDNAFGLMGMRERGRMLGGSVEIESKPTIGTCVSLTIPLENIEENK
ncbi:PAS domain S-box protein [Klebsiella indica]|uniref:PAS domain S-box protein n=1 Tax=Klebsiella indica TaxID=2582917 RepID=A0A5R9LDZ5_9ENTR|nr:PAS domain S-box protein [Klebsiella indica]TLV11641.1 PAS domain S-box protein [Klebsiella indica]